MQTNLSPLPLSGLRVTAERECSIPPVIEDEGKKRRRTRGRVEEIVRYMCPVCSEEHDDRSDAEDCCPDDGDEDTPGAVLKGSCPVCGHESGDPFLAAECCLWKDTVPQQRWQIATMVESGKSWTEAIEQVTGAKLNPFTQ